MTKEESERINPALVKWGHSIFQKKKNIWEIPINSTSVEEIMSLSKIRNCDLNGLKYRPNIIKRLYYKVRDFFWNKNHLEAEILKKNRVKRKKPVSIKDLEETIKKHYPDHP